MTNHDNNAWARRAREWRDLQKLLTLDEEALRRIENEAPQPTDEAGMTWWNGLSDQQRAKWGQRVPTGRAVDCWRRYKLDREQESKDCDK